jgi:hypothetical protein
MPLQNPEISTHRQRDRLTSESNNVMMSLGEPHMERVKRTQVYLDCAIYRKLKREALEKGISMSSFLREILNEYFYSAQKSLPKKQDIKNLIGMFRDPAENVARHHDDYLVGTEDENIH